MGVLIIAISLQDRVYVQQNEEVTIHVFSFLDVIGLLGIWTMYIYSIRVCTSVVEQAQYILTVLVSFEV